MSERVEIKIGDSWWPVEKAVSVEIISLRAQLERARAALGDAALQLEYIQERMPTGSGAAAIARARAALTEMSHG